MTAAETARPLSVMVKPVGSRCNLRCGYCYYLGTDERVGTEAIPRMADADLENLIRRCIAASPGPVVSFVWHGGEPCLAGLDFYRRAVALQKKYLPEGWQCWNNLQTNGVLLDGEWCDFLAEERFDVGVSIDGAPWLHDRFRLDSAGRGTYERAADAVRRLKARGIRPDLLCTVNAATEREPEAVYRALRNLDTGWVQFIPIVCRDGAGNVTPDSVTPEGYGRFLCTVFNQWLYHDVGKMDVQLFAEMALVLSGGSPTLCWMSQTCGRVLVVERDGGVYSCDHFVDTAHRLGNLRDDALEALAESSAQVAFGEAKRTGLTEKCRACRWLPLCGGGCPKDRFVPSESGGPGQNYLCPGLEKLFAHADKPLKTLVDLYRKKTPLPAILARLREEELQRWKGVGRNDPCPCGSGKKAKHCCWPLRP